MRSVLLLSCCCLLGVSTSARGDIIYQYITDAVANNGTINATAGQDITIKLFLKETLTSGSTSLLASQGGLGTFGFQLTRTTGTSTVINASLATIDPSVWTGGANLTNPNSGTTGTQSYLGNTNISAGAGLDGTGKVLLATAHLTAGAAGSSTTFQIKDGGFFGPGNTTAFNSPNFDLDSTNNAPAGGATYTGAAGNPYTFTVNVSVAAVPEPASMVLTGLAASFMGFGAWRRRRSRRESIAVPKV